MHQRYTEVPNCQSCNNLSQRLNVLVLHYKPESTKYIPILFFSPLINFCMPWRNSQTFKFVLNAATGDTGQKHETVWGLYNRDCGREQGRRHKQIQNSLRESDEETGSGLLLWLEDGVRRRFGTVDGTCKIWLFHLSQKKEHHPGFLSNTLLPWVRHKGKGRCVALKLSAITHQKMKPDSLSFMNPYWYIQMMKNN